MLDFESIHERRGRETRMQVGATIVEFSLVISLFLTFIFAVIELARLMFLYNTLPDVTRRAATATAATDFTKAAEIDTLRQRAIFRNSSGSLVLMTELTDQAVRIDYLSVSKASDGTLSMLPISGGALPASPRENRATCLADPYATNCIRFVRVRICDPADTAICQAIKFRTLTTLAQFSIDLPIATTIAQAQSLGMVPN